jgi:CO/xanthine dehydrogenase Mo-binding subunit
MAAGGEFDRRSFLVGAGIAGGGLTLGIAIPFASERVHPAAGPSEITCWVVIAPDDTVTIRVAHAEMGQGALTGLAMLVAEELECDWAKVRTEFVAPEENLRRNRVWGDTSTGASRSIATSQNYLRRAGAAARAMLIAAAAARWNVPSRGMRRAFEHDQTCAQRPHRELRCGRRRRRQARSARRRQTQSPRRMEAGRHAAAAARYP